MKEEKSKHNEILSINREDIINAYMLASDEEKTLLKQLFGEKVKPIDIKERLNNFTDVLEYHDISERDFYTSCLGLSNDEIAYKRLKLIVSAYNEGKEVEKPVGVYARKLIDNSFNIEALGEYDYSGSEWMVLNRLSFNDLNNAKDAIEKFKEVFEAFLIPSL